MSDLWFSLTASARRMIYLCLVVHAVVAFSLNLSTDEAHYALYAAHLDWSYFDHPPLVGWLQWPALWLGGSDGLLRIVPMLCWLLTALTLAALVQAFAANASRRASFNPSGHDVVPSSALVTMCLSLFALSPLHHLLGIALVPDSLLMPLIAVIMLLNWRLRDTARASLLAKSWGLWLGLGLCLGLTGLAKYTGVLFALSSLVYLCHSHGKRLLQMHGLWLAAGVAALMVLPVFYWNAKHDWVSFSYQLNHAKGGDPWLLRRTVAYALLQFITYGVLLVVGAIMSWLATVSAYHPARFLCMVFGLPPLLLTIYMAGSGNALPHWTGPAWVALLPLAAIGWSTLTIKTNKAVAWYKGFRAWQCLLLALALGLLLIGGVAFERAVQTQSLPGDRSHAPINPIADLYGWQAAAQRAQQLAQTRGIEHLAVMNWSLASRVAWYARPMPVWVIHSHQDQFDLWFGRPDADASAIVVDWSLLSDPAAVARNEFEHCELLEQYPSQHLGQQLSHFNISLCSHWRGKQVSK